jgi:DNA replication protein DnaC
MNSVTGIMGQAVDPAVLQEHEERCRREESRAKERRLEQFNSALPARYHSSRVSLDRFEVRHKGQKLILDRVQALAGRLPEIVKRGECIVWYGTPGTGKDHMMMALLHQAFQRGLRCRWWQGSALYDVLRARSRGDNLPLWSDGTPDILAISDPVTPGAEVPGWLLGQLFGVIDGRYSSMRPTFLTVNANSEEELAAHLSGQLFDRLKHNGHLLPCFWPSYRSEQK